MNKRKHRLIYLVYFSLSILLTSCYATKTREVPIYSTRQVPYQVTETVSTSIPPLVPGNNHVIAFIRFAGGDVPTVEQVLENIKLGFQEQQYNDKNIVKNIRFISRAELLRTFTRSELEEMGPDVENRLINIYGVDIICTGTILSSSDYRLSIEVLDYETNITYNDVFSGYGWSSVGSEVAKAFFGTRQKTYEVTVTKYREERYTSDYKIETYRVQNHSLGYAIVLLIALGLTILVLGN